MRRCSSAWLTRRDHGLNSIWNHPETATPSRASGKGFFIEMANDEVLGVFDRNFADGMAEKWRKNEKQSSEVGGHLTGGGSVEWRAGSSGDQSRAVQNSSSWPETFNVAPAFGLRVLEHRFVPREMDSRHRSNGHSLSEFGLNCTFRRNVVAVVCDRRLIIRTALTERRHSVISNRD
jgi:hypothetical protein